MLDPNRVHKGFLSQHMPNFELHQFEWDAFRTVKPSHPKCHPNAFFKQGAGLHPIVVIKARRNANQSN